MTREWKGIDIPKGGSDEGGLTSAPHPATSPSAPRRARQRRESLTLQFTSTAPSVTSRPHPPQPPRSVVRTKWTRRVPHPVLLGHAPPIPPRVWAAAPMTCELAGRRRCTCTRSTRTRRSGLPRTARWAPRCCTARARGAARRLKRRPPRPPRSLPRPPPLLTVARTRVPTVHPPAVAYREPTPRVRTRTQRQATTPCPISTG